MVVWLSGLDVAPGETVVVWLSGLDVAPGGTVVVWLSGLDIVFFTAPVEQTYAVYSSDMGSNTFVFESI